jgi:glycerol uptake facilitator-like aquaporin
MNTPRPRARCLLAELVGSALLAAVVIGSGIAAQQLSPLQIGLELFENAAATAAGLYAIILMFGPVCGGHFDPVVSFVDAAFAGISRRDALAYLAAQVGGSSSARSSPTRCSPKWRSASPPTTAPARLTSSLR